MTNSRLNSVREYFDFSPTVKESELFKKMITVSIIIHIAVFIFFGVKASLFSADPIELDPTIRVDMVGLPDKMAKLPEELKPIEKSKVEPLPAPKVETKAEPEKPVIKEPVVLKPKHDTTKAIEKIKKMAKAEERKHALESIQQQVKAEEQKADRQAKVSQILKGNAVNSGSALHGLMKSDFNDYANQVHNHIHEHWSLPEWLQNDSLSATVVVFLDSRGVVVKRVVRKSSGDPRFDDYVLKAVDEASPFPKPPEKFVELVRDDGIALGFPQ